MYKLLFFVTVLLCAGCGSGRVIPPGAVAPPPAAAQTSGATEDLIAQKADATAQGDKVKAKALKAAIADQSNAETDGDLRRLIWLGVLVLAAGAGIAWYLGPKLGGGVAVVGASMIAGALFIQSIKPYIGWVTFGGCGIGAIAVAYHFRKYFSALSHSLHGTEHLASDGVKSLISKIRTSGPSYLTQFKSLMHHHSATVMGNVPVSTRALPQEAPKA
jgi:hypothetical protein